MMRRCTKCNNNFPLSEYYYCSRDGYFTRCKRCMSEIRKLQYKKNKGKERKSNKNWIANNKERWKELSRKCSLKRKYNMTPQKYGELWLSQKGKCKICYERKPLNIDHCHKSNKVRGLLCKNCNFGIGSLKDDIGILTSAIQYLKRSLK